MLFHRKFASKIEYNALPTKKISTHMAYAGVLIPYIGNLGIISSSIINQTGSGDHLSIVRRRSFI